MKRNEGRGRTADKITETKEEQELLVFLYELCLGACTGVTRDINSQLAQSLWGMSIGNHLWILGR